MFKYRGMMSDSNKKRNLIHSLDTTWNGFVGVLVRIELLGSQCQLGGDPGVQQKNPVAPLATASAAA